MNRTEQSAKTPSRRTGCSAALRALHSRLELRAPAFVLLGGALVALSCLAGAPSAQAETCSNEARRSEQGAAALALPDCRAYELVSPLGAQPYFATFGIGKGEGRGAVAALGGDRFSFFSTAPPHGSLTDGPYYLSTRGGGGWSTQNLIPPQSREVDDACLPYMAAFSPDLARGILADGFSTPHSCGTDEPPLVAGEPRGFQNLFLRDNETGAYQLVNLTPAGLTPFNAFFESASTDLSHVVFVEAARLTPEAPEILPEPEPSDLYESYAGAVHLLTILPDGSPSRGQLVDAVNSSGNGAGELHELRRFPTFPHAVSADGERVFWQTAITARLIRSRPTGLYLRLNAAQQPSASGECSPAEPTAACTVRLDTVQSGSGEGNAEPQFQWASADGSRAFFTDEQRLTEDSNAAPGKPDLYEYDLQRPPGERLTDLTAGPEPGDALGVAGASADGSYLYFVANGALAPNANSHGDTAVAPATATGTLSAATGTGALTKGSTTVASLSLAKGEFAAGQEISGTGIPTGATVASVGAGSLELSLAATETGAASLTAGSKHVSALSAATGTLLPGMAIAATGIPAGTKIAAVGSGTLELSNPATASGPQALSATEPNLYLRHEGATTFIAALAPRISQTLGPNSSEEDPSGGDSCDWMEFGIGGEACDTARVSPDGAFLAFNSIHSLTGYDNTPPNPADCVEEGAVPQPQPCREVFLYDAAQHQLSCASCDPGGAPPSAPASIRPPALLFTFADVPTHLQRNLSDGGRVFFDTAGSLLPADTNATSDVYQYQAGQLQLISTGTSPAPSYFYEASASGNDVFLITAQPLVRTDTDGEVSVYDARAGGGFPEPPPAPICEAGPSCHGPTPPPPAKSSPATPRFQGPGNEPPPPGCKKGFVRKHGTCVKRHSKKHSKKHKRANTTRRAGK